MLSKNRPRAKNTMHKKQRFIFKARGPGGEASELFARSTWEEPSAGFNESWQGVHQQLISKLLRADFNWLRMSRPSQFSHYFGHGFITECKDSVGGGGGSEDESPACFFHSSLKRCSRDRLKNVFVSRPKGRLRLFIFFSFLSRKLERIRKHERDFFCAFFCVLASVGRLRLAVNVFEFQPEIQRFKRMVVLLVPRDEKLFIFFYRV